MSETLEAFAARMANVEKEEEFQVGSFYAGHSRAVFKFEGQICYLESYGYRRLPPGGGGFSKNALLHSIALSAIFHPPVDCWWTDYMICGKDRAEAVAKEYGATLLEAPYAAEDGKWFSLWFDEDTDGDGFNRLIKFVHDRHTGAFNEKWDEEPELYRSCLCPEKSEKMV